MVMWIYVPERRVKNSELESIQRQRICLTCTGYLARVAERDPAPYYNWTPNGYICTKCNLCYMSVP
jgi:hypothetical protein